MKSLIVQKGTFSTHSLHLYLLYCFLVEFYVLSFIPTASWEISLQGKEWVNWRVSIRNGVPAYGALQSYGAQGPETMNPSFTVQEWISSRPHSFTPPKHTYANTLSDTLREDVIVKPHTACVTPSCVLLVGGSSSLGSYIPCSAVSAITQQMTCAKRTSLKVEERVGQVENPRPFLAQTMICSLTSLQSALWPVFRSTIQGVGWCS